MVTMSRFDEACRVVDERCAALASAVDEVTVALKEEAGALKQHIDSGKQQMAAVASSLKNSMSNFEKSVEKFSGIFGNPLPGTLLLADGGNSAGGQVAADAIGKLMLVLSKYASFSFFYVFEAVK